MMHLARFDPFAVIRDLDRSFGERFESWTPRIDAFDRGTELVIRLEVAGIDAEDIDITVEDHTLTISGSREDMSLSEGDRFHRREIFTGEFKRTLNLPDALDADEIKAKAENGILEITIPRRAEVLPRKVKVDVTG